MFCTRCRQFEAAPDGVLCRRCEAEDAHPTAASPGGTPGMPLPVMTPHGAAWLRSPVGLGRAVAVLLGVVAAVDLLAVWADLALLDVMGRMTDGVWGADVDRDYDRADGLITLAGLLQTLSLVATVIVFLIWFHRVRVNAEVFDPFGHKKKRGWAIGGWFVPVVCFWFPRRIAIDSWDASSPWEKPRSHTLVNTWWTLWAISLFAGEVGDRAYIRAESAEEYGWAARQLLFADALEIVAAVFAALFVLALTRMQDDKARSGPRVPEHVSL